MKNLIDDHVILEIVSGSHLYGTNVKTSDKDYVGIFIAPPAYYIGLDSVSEVDLSEVKKDESGKNTVDSIDRKFYELRKFVKLALDNNPNILEILFVNNKNVVYENDFGVHLRNNARRFVWAGCAQKFLGYAFAQKHKMMIKPANMEEIQKAIDFFLQFPSSTSIIDTGYEVFVGTFKSSDQHIKIGDIHIQRNGKVGSELRKLTERRNKFTNREELISKYGYDTKFAMHLIRLMYEGLELLETGAISFPLKQADYLLKIRNGEYSVEQILEHADVLESELNYWKEHTKLPKAPRYQEINKILMEMVMDNFGWE